MNWNQYNTNLKKRGSLHFWIDENIGTWWYANEKNKPGKPKIYSDKAIRICLQLRSFFRLPLRALEGFVNSIFFYMRVDLKAPSYTQISRRTEGLKPVQLSWSAGAIFNIAVDSTGLKVFGEGEWKVRQHGAGKRRVWRKIHLAIDTSNHQILSHKTTSSSISDGQAFTEMASPLQDKVKNSYFDGAYDQKKCYEMIRKIGGNPIIPPRKNARIQSKIVNPAKIPRDQAIAKIKLLGGDDEARKLWKKEVGYHQRSLAETAMFRLKNTFGNRLQSRKFENQKVEIDVKVSMLNKIASLGMPKNM